MRLIDADELMKHKGNCYDEEGHLLYAVGTGTIMMMPTIDAVPVVRCKDCKRHNGAFGDFLINEQRYLREDEVCPLVYWRGKAKGNEFDYQYCIYGERRTNETD